MSNAGPLSSSAISTKAKWTMRLALMLLSPVVALLLAEAGLRLAGYGYPVSFFVWSPSNQAYLTNQKFAWQFFSPNTALKPFLFSITEKKPAGTLRICVLGESAAMGTPDPAFGFPRILESMLQRQYPQVRFEVMNAAMRGINSYVIRRIARECARFDVDLFIIYMGNNEVVGLHAPTPGARRWTQSLLLIRAGEWARRARVGQWLSALLSPGPEGRSQTMDYFHAHQIAADDPIREKNRENFSANLGNILETARGSGAKTILSTVAVNLKDCPPFASLHRRDLAAPDLKRWEAAVEEGDDLQRNGQPGKAIEKYSEAAAIDGHFAELHYKLGECYWSKQDWSAAREQFSLARDWDALQFRTDTRFNQVIREAAATRASEGVALLDSEKQFTESELSQHGVPGADLFYEHVHPTFAGNYLLAKGCFDAVARVLASKLKTPAESRFPTPQEVADEIAYTPYDEVNTIAAMVRLTASPPFLDQLNHTARQAAAEAASKKRLASFGPVEAQLSLDQYTVALRKRPNDWPIRFNLALFCQEMKRNSDAVEQFDYLVRGFPDVKNFRVGLANALVSCGSNLLAVPHLEHAFRLDPRDANLRKELQALKAETRVP